ncbi:MAG TPA: purple acid phosphatase [Porphyromonadaceae bacterium]|jgi:predicted phosphodiesterase|nr:purple acid phosphatase [Porphyromonadaceae bacterium]HBK32711.1 purple acid phosphatase [Porphyromonadaceae bacterium]HBL33811.1 purple acid phosphatase [Porphyromonadaceae bacterium]HBX20032.1 purple acid phosphatase [Porphyromonadaceae bacterium]
MSKFTFSLPALFLITFLQVVSYVSGQTSNIKIAQNPYLQALTDSTVSILWTTDKPAIAWVELAPDDESHFYQQERPQFHDSRYGFNRIGTLHQVNLKKLTPGTKYRYRVYAREVLAHEGAYVQYGRTAASNVFNKQPLAFRTASRKDTLRFLVVNDIHGDNELLRNLIGRQDPLKMDFVVLNGDMVNQLLSEKQMFDDFMHTTIDLFGGSIPFYYSRGNHETRGPFAFSYPEFFPTSNGQLYYTFRYGDAFFIVLDSGEDKPDSDIEYSGLADMDNYRTEQAEWLKGVVRSKEFNESTYRIVISHMPPFGDWHGSLDLAKKFLPILNNAKIDIMLCGHLHRHVFRKADKECHFPILVNSNRNVVKATICKKEAALLVVDRQGKTIESITINPK